MNQRSHSFEKEFNFTDEDFNFLSQRAAKMAGINLNHDKRELVYGRVAKRLRQLGLNSFSEYCKLLRADDNEESRCFINLITTNVTSFFRENHHFEYLAKQVIPRIIANSDRLDTPQLRIWSAGCSTGEEAYSVAMVLCETIPNIQRWDIKILATDLDTDVLNTARSGIYPVERIQQLSNERKKKWFFMGVGNMTGQAKVRPEVRKLVHFKQLNLTQSWPVSAKFDCIFFRNVAIYFKQTTQINILNRFAEHLHKNGSLFVGHSESMIGLSQRYINIGQTIHQVRD